MSLWRRLTRGLRAMTNRPAADQDVADEVQDYLERATAAHLAAGLTPEKALRAARLELGSPTSAREAVRGVGWENVVEILIADLRYAARRLRAEPGFTAVTVLTLAVGIGATTAIFGAASPILFQPLPYPGAGRIVSIREAAPNGSSISGTFGSYHALADRARSFEALAVLKTWQPTVSGSDQPERLEGQSVSAGFFRVLGISPSLGQDFRTGDDVRGGARVVILGNALWRRRFRGDSAILGRPITLDGDPYVVVGVMPKGFENVLAPTAALWTLLQYDMSDGRAWGHHLRMIGRLRPGVGAEQASRELTGFAPELVRLAAAADGYFPGGFLITSLHEDVTRGVKPALLVLLGAVSLVLVIACVNVTNLLLGRGVRRRGEFSLRAALGAGRSRLIRQLLTESALLALTGGVVGVIVAMVGVRALVALSPPALPRAGAIGVDGGVFAFALVITALIGLAFGVTPALQAAGSDPHRELQLGSRRTVGGHGRTRGALVVAEVALALVLLVSSGLLLRSLRRLFGVEAGFATSHLLTMQIQTSGHRFNADTATYRFFAEALEAVRQVPGVSGAALTSQLPLSGDLDEYGVLFDPPPAGNRMGGFSVFRYAVSPGFTETMGIPLRAGRVLDPRDQAGAPLAVVISASLARHKFSAADPLGQRLHIGPLNGPLYTIVGVVGDVKQQSLALSESDAVYITAAQWQFPDNAMSLVVRARGDPAALAPAIRRAVWSVDRDQAIARVATMDDLLAASAAERRFALILFEAFGLAALVLAAAGIYGVLAGSVAERTREIGVRAALGASRGRIVSLVVRQGMTLTGLGLALGVAGAAAATRTIVAMLFGVSHLDPLTYFGVIGLLAGVAILACGVPAWRAARVDPASTLRAE
jgi:putative ABC transport system permease protein